NHLDLETREALAVALAQFEGTLILVSHDRHLLRATTDEFMIVADGRVSPFDGDLDDYREWLFRTKLADGDAAPLPQKKEEAPRPAIDRRQQKRVEAEARQRLSAARKPIESRLKRLEEQIAKLGPKKAEIEAKLAGGAIYEEANKEALKALLLDQAYVARELAQLEGEWLQLQEQLERLAV